MKTGLGRRWTDAVLLPLLAPLTLSLTISACGSDDAKSADPADWSSYGRDYANTRTNPNETAISPANVATLVPKWKFTEAAVTSTPAVRDGNLYFGDWNSVFHAYELKTGRELWRSQVQPNMAPNQINNSALVTEDTIYTGAQGALLAALDRETGETKWAFNIDEQRLLMLWSSPVLVDGTIIIGIGSFQVFLPMTPPFRGNLVGINAKDGTVKWRTYVTEGSGVSIWSSAAVDQTRKLAYIGTGQEYTSGASSPYSDSLLAIDYETGAIKWAAQFTANDRFQAGDMEGPDHDVGAAPNLFEVNGRALVGVGDKGGRYFACDRDTGAIVWKAELSTGGANGGVMASTAYDKGVIFVASNDGTTGGEAGEGGGPGAGFVLALNAADGTVKWKVPSVPGTFGALAVANGLVYVPTLAGKLRAHDVNTGTVLWDGMVGESMGGGVTVSDGMVIAGHGWSWVPLGFTPGGLVVFGLPGQ